MEFKLNLNFDEVSTKSRTSEEIRQILDKLFAKHGLNPDERFLRITRNQNRKNARSTTYVLNEGVLNSPLCFSLAKFRRERTTWITPNGWKTASISFSIVFTAECRIFGTEMKYRFAKVVKNSKSSVDELVGSWHTNIQQAFATLCHLFTPEYILKLSKVSKEVLLAVHCSLVQKQLTSHWHDLKLSLSPENRLYASAMEAHLSSTLSNLPGHMSATAVTVPSPLLNPPPPMFPTLENLQISRILAAHEIVRVFSTVEGFSVPDRAITDLLYLLEAGLGAKFEFVLHFLYLVEDSISQIWHKVEQHAKLVEVLAALLGKQTSSAEESAAVWLSRLSQNLPDSTTLRFRAILLVFERMRHLFPNMECLKQETIFTFRRKITMLPDVTTTRKRLKDLFPVESQEFLEPKDFKPFPT